MEKLQQTSHEHGDIRMGGRREREDALVPRRLGELLKQVGSDLSYFWNVHLVEDDDLKGKQRRVARTGSTSMQAKETS